MCSCVQSAVHIYEPRSSFLENLLGRDVTRWLAEKLGMVEPSEFGFLCSCGDGYLGSALGGGIYSLFALLAALAAGAVFPARPRIAAVIAALWVPLVIGGMYARYIERAEWAERVPADRHAQFAEYLSSYLAAMPAQFAANILFALIVPAALVYAVVKGFGALYWAAVRRAESQASVVGQRDRPVDPLSRD